MEQNQISIFNALSSQLYNDDGYIVVNASDERAIDDKRRLLVMLYLKSKSEDMRIQEIANLYKEWNDRGYCRKSYC